MYFPRVSVFVILFAVGAMQAAAVDSALEFCVVEPFGAEPYLPHAQWPPKSCKSELNTTLAVSEIEAVSFLMRSAVEHNGLIITATDLVGDGGVIEADQLDIKYVKAWYQAGTAWQGIEQDKSRRKLVPELLLNDDNLIKIDFQSKRNYARLVNGSYVDISSDANSAEIHSPPIYEFNLNDAEKLAPLLLPAQFTKQILVTVKSAASAPGIYRGLITIQGNSPAISTAIPIKVEILPIKLTEPALEYSIYYRGLLRSRGTISSEEKNERQFIAELTNMREHGISNPTIYQEPVVYQMRRVLELRERVGFASDNLYYLGITTGNYADAKSMKQRYSQFGKIAALLDAQQTLFVYGIDEAEKHDIPQQYPAWKKISSLGGKIFAADWIGGKEELLGGRVAVVISGIAPDPDINAKFQQQGTKVYQYNKPQIGVENPYVYRQLYGFNAWQNKFDGVMNYAYQHSFGFVWNDFDHHKFRDHVFAYPTASGVIDTLAWEGFREGVDDVRYISTLVWMSKNYKAPILDSFIENFRAERDIDPSEARKEIAKLILETCDQLKTSGIMSPICL